MRCVHAPSTLAHSGWRPVSERVFSNARIVLESEVIRGTLAFDRSGIIGLSQGRSSLPQAIDVGGDYICPGLVELHTDNLERHVKPRPNSYWPVEAAVISHDREVSAAGITTVLDALSIGQIDPNSRQVHTLSEICHAATESRAKGHLKADHYLHLRCEVSYGDLIDLLEPLMDQPLVRLISVMDHTPGQRQFVSLEQYATYYQGKYKLSDDQLATFMSEQVASQKLNSARNRRRVVELARGLDICLASHDDATMDHVGEAVADGIVVAEFPTTMQAARASHEHGLSVLMGGPNVVRGKSHNGNVSARDMADAGLLDIVSSDYVPSSLLYAALLLEEKIEAIDMPRAISMVTRTPARQIGLVDRGVLANGMRSDFVWFTRTASGPVIREVWRQGERIA